MSAALDIRQQRGMEIAATQRITRRKPGLWIVPSASHAGSYIVETEGEKASCTCKDHEKRQQRCKHIFAVEYARRRETMPDGTVKETETVRVTYSQEWSSYNAAQVNEREHFDSLLRDLCDGIEEQPQVGKGRPRLPMADRVYSSVAKVYAGTSGRRASSEIQELADRKMLTKAPHYNSIHRYLEDPAMTPVLLALVEQSAAPLAAVESQFAVDSTGFSTNTYARWFDHKWGKERKERNWLKAHLMVGTRTHVVTSCRITDEGTHDSVPFLPLTKSTAARFDMKELSADKAYLSHQNVTIADGMGITPYIPMKSNVNGVRGLDAWHKLYHLFHYKAGEFYAHYNMRSNVETVNSMIKRKFGAFVRAKSKPAQINEVLCKVLAHNVCVLIAEMYALGIDPTFGAVKVDASDVSPK
jgi:transposase